MEKKRRNLRIVMILAMMLAFCFGQEAWAAAKSAVASGNWSSGATWNGGTVPTSADDVTISAFTVTLDTDVEVASLTLDNAASVLTVGAGDTVSITVNGNIDLSDAGAGFIGVANTTGRINLIVGAASTITNTVDANGTVGLNVHNFTIEDASVSYAGDFVVRITGDFALTGTSSFTPAANTDGTATFYGGYESTQNISVSSNSYCEFVNITLDGSANVATTSDFTIRELLTITTPASDDFNATAGTITFNPNANQACVVNTGLATAAVTNLKFYDVLFNCASFDATPATSFIVGGNFTKIGAQDFAPTDGFVVFENADPVGKTIQVLGGTNNFWDMQIGSTPNFKTTKVKTTSDFLIGGDLISVISNSSFIAEAGTISVDGAASVITNSSTGTLEFNNLTMTANATGATTASSFTIAGNLTITAAGQLIASAGTITFDNTLQKTVDNSGGAATDLTFYNVTVAASSDITTATDFTVTGNMTLAADAELTATAATAYWAGGTTKTITVASDANLEFNDFIVNDVAANAVQTTSNFKVNGTAFTLAGAANGTFTATTPSTITFTADAVLTAPSATRMYFHNLYVNAADADVTIAAGDFVYFTGNLTVNGATATFVSATDGTVTFQGTSNSVIGVGATTPASPAVTFGRLTINKIGASGSDEVQMETNVTIANAAGTTITLTDGILDMGSSTLTVGANTIPSATAGAINGATGTYVVSTGHAVGLTDALFTVGGTPTLYNLDVLVAHTLGAGNLTINGDLEFTGAVALTIPATRTLTLYGDMTHTAAGTITAAAAGTSVLRLRGTGTCDQFATASFGTVPCITLERAETLTGNLTFAAANVFTLNSSINVLDIGAYTLTFNATTVLNLVSGSIDADAGAVVFSTHASQTTIPANLFTNNTVNDLTVAAATTLGSDLTINGTLTGLFQITTNDNTLTFGPNATIPAYVAATHIVGNLKKTVTSTATVFPVGGGTAATFRPVALAFSTLGSEQVVKVSSVLTNPALGRAGDPERAINSVWTITPEGTAPNDSLALELGWGATQDNGLAVGANTSFAARWNSTYWRDFRNEYSLVATGNFASNSELAMTASRFPIDADSLSGIWGVFVATANTTTAKDNAISNSKYKVVVLDVTPNPVSSGFPFSVTVQLQDANGNPVNVPTANGAVTVNLTTLTGTGTALTGTTVPGVIPVGSNNVTVSGVSITSGSGEFGTQIKAALPSTITGLEASPTTFLAGVSERIGILADQPTSQVNTIVLTPSTTSMTLDFTSAIGANIIIAKAGSAITDAEFPVDGTTYIASANYGQGSTIGDAVVIYKGADPAAAVTINGLAPGTTYYVRGFAYTGSNGSEKYLTFSAAGNPKSAATTGGVNDDTEYGDNDSRSLARPVGTNSAIRGTIESASDEDWFSFAVTSVSPNVRARLYDLPGNYTLELYNMDGRRIRRSTLSGTENEAMIANDLPPGTYTVRIFSQDGSYYTQSGDEYYLKVTTSSSEIFSVTP